MSPNPSSSVSRGDADQPAPSRQSDVKKLTKGTLSGLITEPTTDQVMPGSGLVTTKTVAAGTSAGLKAPLGPGEIQAPISNDEINRVEDTVHRSYQDAQAKFQLNKMPFISDGTAGKMTEISNSPEFVEIMKASTAKMQNSSGLDNDLVNSVSKLGNPPTGAHANYAKSIENENTIDIASRRLMTANENFYKTIAKNCPNYKDNKVCVNFSKLQNDLVNIKLQEIIFENLRSQEQIGEAIKLNNEQQMAILRLRELLATRMSEVSDLEKEINRLSTEITVNSRSNEYNIQVKDTNREWQTFIIFMYYEFFLFYIIVSNFFPDGHYKKIVPVLLLILYILFPIIMKYSTIIFQNLYISLREMLGNYPRKVKTLTD
jgi:hypothetical protein